MKSISDIIKGQDRVMKTLLKLGQCDTQCNVKWLINTLNDIGEYKPLLDILGTGNLSMKIINSFMPFYS